MRQKLIVPAFWLAFGLAVLSATSPAAAERPLPWYRGFYLRGGIRDSAGVQESFHAWAAFSFGIGYRIDRQWWALDISAFDYQRDPEEGMHTIGRVLPTLSLASVLCVDAWVGAGLSFGWVKGTVYEAIPKHRGQGWQSELAVGMELPRSIRLRTFVQGTLTLPLYNTYDSYHSRDSALYVFAFEAALGLRF